jgi:hypothetical protein
MMIECMLVGLLSLGSIGCVQHPYATPPVEQRTPLPRRKPKPRADTPRVAEHLHANPEAAIHQIGWEKPIPVFPDWKALPPLEYDYPCEGVLTIVRTREDFRDANLCVVPKGRDVLACAMRFRNSDGSLAPKCEIYIAPEAILRRYGISYEDALRHEMAHCNGWVRITLELDR